MEFEGREHCGMDDTRNIARIAIQLLRDGRVLHCNDTTNGVSTKRLRHYTEAGVDTARLPAFQRTAEVAAVDAVSMDETAGGEGGAAAGAAAAAVFELFCDLDGVLADFDAGIQKLTGRDPGELGSAQMWRAVSRYDGAKGFFGSLALMPDARDLWSAITPASPTILSGIPHSDSRKAAKQKRDWCTRHLGPDVPVITCASSKKAEYMAASGKRMERNGRELKIAPISILIDDRSRNGRAWEAAGGLFVLHTSAAETIVQLRALDRELSLGLFP